LDSKRERLFALCREIIGSQFHVVLERPENTEFSHKYIAVDNKSLAFSSTGTRLLITLFGLCFHDEFEVLLIDEPELGLSPGAQSIVIDYLYDEQKRLEYFPHLIHLFVATHSQIFLDRTDIKNNFIVEKASDLVHVRQIQEVALFHNLQFNMLGNKLETMFFPECIVIVEGGTDKKFLERLLPLKFPGNRIAIVPSRGDPKRKVHDVRELVGDLQKSPFGQRPFVVLDSRHQPSLTRELVAMGIRSDNVVIWEKNGIEFVYPRDIMAKIFVCSEEEVGNMVISSDTVAIGQFHRRKMELCDEVVNVMTLESRYPQELETKLFREIESRIS
jgi:hypothetical protein